MFTVTSWVKDYFKEIITLVSFIGRIVFRTNLQVLQGLSTEHLTYEQDTLNCQQEVWPTNRTLGLQTGLFTHQQVSFPTKKTYIMSSNVYKTWTYRLMQKHTQRMKSREGLYSNGKSRTDTPSAPLNPGKYGCKCLPKHESRLSSNTSPFSSATLAGWIVRKVWNGGVASFKLASGCVVTPWWNRAYHLWNGCRVRS